MMFIVPLCLRETKARKGDGEYVRVSEAAGKHESGDNHGHFLPSLTARTQPMMPMTARK